MNLIVQNNSGTVQGANSYISFVEGCARLAGRIDLPNYTDEQVIEALANSTNHIDSIFYFRGNKFAGEGQSTEFPRIDGEEASMIPNQIKDAVCEYVIWFLTGGLSMLISPPEEYIGDRYDKKGDDVVADYVHQIEEEAQDGKKYLAFSESYLYESGWLLLKEEE